MARCGCGNQTCSCIITAGDGVIVSGLGTPTRPYEISLTTAGAGLTESIIATPTNTLKLYTNGAGTPDNPLNIYGNVTVKMTDVTDVADPEGPATGDVIVYVTDHWEFRPPTAAPPGSVNVSNPLTGDGSAGAPLGLKTSGFWGTAPLDKYGASSVVGEPTYVDSAGQLRAQPRDTDVYPLNAPTSTFVATTQVYTALSETELPTPVRAAVTNRHTSRRLLVRVETQSVFEQTNSITAAQVMFSGLLVQAGAPTPMTGHPLGWRSSVPPNDSTTGRASYSWGLYWLPAGASATWGVSAWKTNGTATCQARNVTITATPIRYE